MLHFFLRLQITRSTKGLFLTQTKYAHDLLQKNNMFFAKPAKTPCAPNLRLVLAIDSLLVDPHTYRSIVRSQHYLTFTRPNLNFVVH